MNRIILIGNGFDLAHELKTRYSDFIDDYWKNTIKEIRSKRDYIKYENEEIIINGRPGRLVTEISTYEELLNDLKPFNSKIDFKNKFLKIITEKKCLKNWVDIESEYYEVLKHSFKSDRDEYNISDLNKDFNGIKKHLEKYLEKATTDTDGVENISNEQLRKRIGDKIYRNFELKDFMQRIKNEQDRLNSTDEPRLDKSTPERVLFLNFNYTTTEKYYMNDTVFYPEMGPKHIVITSIHIHGVLNDSNNPIIFGFGDEIGEDYKQIENLDNNEYLENIKSIQYLKTRHYKDLLQFINSGQYQIFVFGHSCGISDRTLLNTLFEHENCCSIKPFYHRINEKEDNYTDIVSNISRNFNDKKVMRDKVVNKEFCEPLTEFS